MLDISYGVAQSLNYAVARISTMKTKSSRIRVYGVTHLPNYAVTSSRLREILIYEGYAVTYKRSYGVTKLTRVVPISHASCGVTMKWHYGVTRTTKI